MLSRSSLNTPLHTKPKETSSVVGGKSSEKKGSPSRTSASNSPTVQKVDSSIRQSDAENAIESGIGSEIPFILSDAEDDIHNKVEPGTYKHFALGSVIEPPEKSEIHHIHRTKDFWRMFDFESSLYFVILTWYGKVRNGDVKSRYAKQKDAYLNLLTYLREKKYTYDNRIHFAVIDLTKVSPGFKEELSMFLQSSNKNKSSDDKKLKNSNDNYILDGPPAVHIFSKTFVGTSMQGLVKVKSLTYNFVGDTMNGTVIYNNVIGDIVKTVDRLIKGKPNQYLNALVNPSKPFFDIEKMELHLRELRRKDVEAASKQELRGKIGSRIDKDAKIDKKVDNQEEGDNTQQFFGNSSFASEDIAEMNFRLEQERLEAIEKGKMILANRGVIEKSCGDNLPETENRTSEHQPDASLLHISDDVYLTITEHPVVLVLDESITQPDSVAKIATQFLDSSASLPSRATQNKLMIGYLEDVLGRGSMENGAFGVVNIEQEMDIAETLRDELRPFQEWPDFPHLYIGGHFQGGFEDVKQMFEDGSLEVILSTYRMLLKGGTQFTVAKDGSIESGDATPNSSDVTSESSYASDNDGTSPIELGRRPNVKTSAKRRAAPGKGPFLSKSPASGRSPVRSKNSNEQSSNSVIDKKKREILGRNATAGRKGQRLLEKSHSPNPKSSIKFDKHGNAPPDWDPIEFERKRLQGEKSTFSPQSRVRKTSPVLSDAITGLDVLGLQGDLFEFGGQKEKTPQHTHEQSPSSILKAQRDGVPDVVDGYRKRTTMSPDAKSSGREIDRSESPKRVSFDPDAAYTTDDSERYRVFYKPRKEARKKARRMKSSTQCNEENEVNGKFPITVSQTETLSISSRGRERSPKAMRSRRGKVRKKRTYSQTRRLIDEIVEEEYKKESIISDKRMYTDNHRSNNRRRLYDKKRNIDDAPSCALWKSELEQKIASYVNAYPVVILKNTRGLPDDQDKKYVEDVLSLIEFVGSVLADEDFLIFDVAHESEAFKRETLVTEFAKLEAARENSEVRHASSDYGTTPSISTTSAEITSSTHTASTSTPATAQQEYVRPKIGSNMLYIHGTQMGDWTELHRMMEQENDQSSPIITTKPQKELQVPPSYGSTTQTPDTTDSDHHSEKSSHPQSQQDSDQRGETKNANRTLTGKEMVIQVLRDAVEPPADVEELTEGEASRLLRALAQELDDDRSKLESRKTRAHALEVDDLNYLMDERNLKMLEELEHQEVKKGEQKERFYKELVQASLANDTNPKPIQEVYEKYLKATGMENVSESMKSMSETDILSILLGVDQEELDDDYSSDEKKHELRRMVLKLSELKQKMYGGENQAMRFMYEVEQNVKANHRRQRQTGLDDNNSDQNGDTDSDTSEMSESTLQDAMQKAIHQMNMAEEIVACIYEKLDVDENVRQVDSKANDNENFQVESKNAQTDFRHALRTQLQKRNEEVARRNEVESDEEE